MGTDIFNEIRLMRAPSKLEYLQGQGNHHLSDQPVPAFHDLSLQQLQAKYKHIAIQIL